MVAVSLKKKKEKKKKQKKKKVKVNKRPIDSFVKSKRILCNLNKQNRLMKLMKWMLTITTTKLCVDATSRPTTSELFFLLQQLQLLLILDALGHSGNAHNMAEVVDGADNGVINVTVFHGVNKT